MHYCGIAEVCGLSYKIRICPQIGHFQNWPLKLFWAKIQENLSTNWTVCLHLTREMMSRGTFENSKIRRGNCWPFEAFQIVSLIEWWPILPCFQNMDWHFCWNWRGQSQYWYGNVINLCDWKIYVKKNNEPWQKGDTNFVCWTNWTLLLNLFEDFSFKRPEPLENLCKNSWKSLEWKLLSS